MYSEVSGCHICAACRKRVTLLKARCTPKNQHCGFFGTRGSLCCRRRTHTRVVLAGSDFPPSFTSMAGMGNSTFDLPELGDACVRFLTNAFAHLRHARPFGDIHENRILGRRWDELELWVRGVRWVWQRSILGPVGLQLGILPRQMCRVTDIVHELFAFSRSWDGGHLLGALPIFCKRLLFHLESRRCAILCDISRGVILRAEKCR